MLGEGRPHVTGFVSTSISEESAQVETAAPCLALSSRPHGSVLCFVG